MGERFWKLISSVPSPHLFVSHIKTFPLLSQFELEQELQAVQGKRTPMRRQFNSAVATLTRPIAPSSLAVVRIAYALLMLREVIVDQFAKTVSMHTAAMVHGEEVLPIYFPLFDSVPRPTPLAVHWLFGVMGVSLVLVALGLSYRVAIVTYTVLYWYFFSLKTTQWTNHVSALTAIF